MWRFWAVLLLALTASLPASAHSRTHLFLGFNFAPAPYCYYPPPAYYYGPPPVYYAPPPTYYYPPTAYSPPPPSNCRTFQGDATIDANGQPFYGTACLGADGRWHIVN